MEDSHAVRSVDSPLEAALLRGLAVCCALAVLGGCAGVTVSLVDTRAYVIEQRGDVLSTGTLSRETTETLRALGVDVATCELAPRSCGDAVVASALLDDEERLSALSELWMQRALRLARLGPEAVHADAIRDAYLETARHAYAYLFFTPRRSTERVFVDRQTQVVDYYNFATTQAIAAIFPRYKGRAPVTPALLQEGRWAILLTIQDGRRAEDRRMPLDLMPASSLRFGGLRNTYRREGIGAELVAVRERPPPSADRPFAEMHVPTLTGLLRFRGETLREVLATGEIDLVAYDPYRHSTVRIAGVEVPLAANFSAGYGLWLAQSGFSGQALRGVLGRATGPAVPRVYLMQPYDPNRRIVITLHGLASSPEAWVNVTNEVLGDETLRDRFQVWQVVYPTNAPILFNHRDVRAAVLATLAYMDPAGTARASREVVLVGHSMGGVLSRLMVSSSGTAIKGEFVGETRLQGEALERAAAEIAPFLAFEPMPEVSRAVFIAAPHRGTPFADRRISRWAANLILLPHDVATSLADLNHTLAGIAGDAGGGVVLRVPNSIENLSERTLALRLADTMPISPRVQYHTIIGNFTPALELADSNDGVVPFRSAHLPGAASEKVVPSGHSVQETPEAILELRRILRLH